MTHADSKNIVDTLHQMELRMAERMVRVETKLEGWRTESEKLAAADKILATEVNKLQERVNRMFTLIIVLGLLAGGDTILRLAAFLPF